MVTLSSYGQNTQPIWTKDFGQHLSTPNIRRSQGQLFDAIRLKFCDESGAFGELQLMIKIRRCSSAEFFELTRFTRRIAIASCTFGPDSTFQFR
jgi:hypothetical protein